MAERPILVFPSATVAAREVLGRGYVPPGPRPSRAEQKRRLSRRLRLIEERFGTIQSEIGGVDPEQVIVFETVGSVSNFQGVVKKIPGMEWLADFDAEIAEPDPGFFLGGAEVASLDGRLFVLVSDRTGYKEILKLWREWLRSKKEKLPYGFGSLATVFSHLQDVRPWGPRDRVLATGVVAYWEKSLAANDPAIRFEVELWWRSALASRAAAYSRLQEVITEGQGQCMTSTAIEEIDYYGVLVELPAETVRQTVQALAEGADTRLLRLSDVKFCAPMGQVAIAPTAPGEPVTLPQKALPATAPVAALLDGLPLANHTALQGRLTIDDPENYSSFYRSGEHRHGTAMASLITHGELDCNEAALSSSLYVRAIMRPGRADASGNRWETLPADTLPVDLVHRAVRRMLVGEGEEAAQAASVKVINLSIGDANQLFDRQMSPWARLLDWLSWTHRVLFIVSAGNHLLDLPIPVPPTAISSVSDEDLRGHALRSAAHQRVQRRLLAPAESLNALTVGALHAQVAPTASAGRLVDLFRGAALPSPICSIASGFKRAIKPEILVPGGRQLYAPKLQPSGPTTQFEILKATGQPGQSAAAPGGSALPPNHSVRVCGTSNAAALTTRRAVQLLEEVALLRQEPGGDALVESRSAVILKTMLVHGASWSGWEGFFDEVFDGVDAGLERRWRIKRICAQLLGYGAADFERGTVCTNQRVIVLGSAELKDGEAHLYNVPLPTALHAQPVRRRLSITLAWATPTNPRHRNYRVADLWFDPPLEALRLKRRDADHTSVKRGTVQHEVLEGEAAVSISEGDVLPIQVNCRLDSPGRRGQVFPYALMVSLETAVPLAVSLYSQVKVALDRLRPRVAVRPSVGASR